MWECSFSQRLASSTSSEYLYYITYARELQEETSGLYYELEVLNDTALSKFEEEKTWHME